MRMRERRAQSHSVRDTGEGHSAQHLDRLFERSYRVDRARFPRIRWYRIGIGYRQTLGAGP